MAFFKNTFEIEETTLLTAWYCRKTIGTLGPAKAGMTKIGPYAFYGFTNLTIIGLPTSLTDIGEHGLQGIKKLTVTEWPSGLTAIGAYGLSKIANLNITTLPNFVTLYEGVCWKSTGLKEMTIPSGVMTVSAYAFDACTDLTKVTFKAKPETIHTTAFSEDTALTDIYVPWAEGAVENAPWGATNATIHYKSEV